MAMVGGREDLRDQGCLTAGWPSADNRLGVRSEALGVTGHRL